MTATDIHSIITKKAFTYPTRECRLIETHISWVILTDAYVYKIKKPLQLSFLDFSTLASRKENCEREVHLNQRLAPEMYLTVLPIRKTNTQIVIGEGEGKIIDYAVLMKRMDESRQMDILLEKGIVLHQQITQLADKIADFHLKAVVIEEGEEWEELHEEFADISSVQKFLSEQFGTRANRLVEEMISYSYRFLSSKTNHIIERNQKGYIIDGHGDLHCRNIFLLDHPVIFDCIEFSDDFRYLDMLSEVAFLYVDLLRFGRDDLADHFCQEYFAKVRCIENEEDMQVFDYYKLYRANVMTKVNAIRTKEEMEAKKCYKFSLQKTKAYLSLCKRLFAILSS